MSAIGMEAGVVGEFAGPVGAAISVAVIIISQFVEAELKVEKLEEHIKLTDQEKHDLYWDFFLGKKTPDYIEHDIEAENIYKQYISKILGQFKDNYDKIAISLPSILVTKEEYLAKGGILGRKRGTEQMYDAMHRSLYTCVSKTRVVDNRFDFGLTTNVSYPPFSVKRGYNHVRQATFKYSWRLWYYLRPSRR